MPLQVPGTRVVAAERRGALRCVSGVQRIAASSTVHGGVQHSQGAAHVCMCAVITACMHSTQNVMLRLNVDSQAAELRQRRV